MTLTPRFGFGGPAMVHLDRCDTIYVDPIEFFKLDEEERRFVLLHEKAHCSGHDGELSADAQALEWFVGEGRDPIEAVEALEKIIDVDHPEPRARLRQIDHLTRKFTGPSGPHMSLFDPTTLIPGAGSAAQASQEVQSNNGGFDWNRFGSDALDTLPDILDVFFGEDNPYQNAPPPPPRRPIPTLYYIIGAAAVIGLLFYAAKNA